MILMREISAPCSAFFGRTTSRKRAIDTKAHHRRRLERLDMNIRRLFARRLREQRVDHADDRRVVFRFEQILDLGNVLHQARQVDFAFHFADDLRRAAVVACVRRIDRSREFGTGKRTMDSAPKLRATSASAASLVLSLIHTSMLSAC